MREVRVFIAHGSKIPQSWIDKIKVACTDESGKEGEIRFVPKCMELEYRHHGIDQNHFFERVDAAGIVFWLIDTDLTTDAQREFDRAVKPERKCLFKRRRIIPKMAYVFAKKYEPGDPEYEKAHDIYKQILRKSDASQEEKDANGQYLRFKTEEELSEKVKGCLHEYTTRLAEELVKQAEANRLRRKKVLIAAAVASILIAGLVYLACKKRREEKAEDTLRSAYQESVGNIKGLIGECTVPTLEMAMDSISDIRRRFPDLIRDEEQLKELNDKALKLRDSLKSIPSPPDLPERDRGVNPPLPEPVVPVTRPPMSVSLSGADGLPTEGIATGLKEGGASFAGTASARWGVSVKERVGK